MSKYDAERFELQRENFLKALNRLKEAMAQNETEFVRDSIIQRFEFTFEMAWKCLYRYLRDKGEDVMPKAFDVLPKALEAGLIQQADDWDQLRAYRNDSSHEYDQSKAIEIVAFVRETGLALFDALAADLIRRG